MSCKQPSIDRKKTLEIAKKLKIDWSKVHFKPGDLQRGIKVEFEHGKCLDGKLSRHNVTNNNLMKTAQIALAHLDENFLYYDTKVGIQVWEKALDKYKKKQLAKMKK